MQPSKAFSLFPSSPGPRDLQGQESHVPHVMDDEGSHGDRASIPGLSTTAQDVASPDTGNVVVLPPDDERAQAIGRAVSSPMARGILRKLSTGPATASEIAGSLHSSVNKTMYHIGQLLEAGLLEVVSTQYSVKGRECKLYGLKERIFVVAPRHTNIKALLLRYTTLFGALIAVSVLIYLLPLLAPRDEPLLTGGGAPAASPAVSSNPVLAFALGGIFIVILVVILEFLSARRMTSDEEEE